MDRDGEAVSGQGGGGGEWTGGGGGEWTDVSEQKGEAREGRIREVEWTGRGHEWQETDDESCAQLGERQIGKGFLYGLATIPSELNTCTYTTSGVIDTWCNLVEWGVSQLVHVGNKQVFKGFEMPACKRGQSLALRTYNLRVYMLWAFT